MRPRLLQVRDFLLGLFAMPLDDAHIETRRHRHAPVETYEVFVEDFNRIETEAETIGTDLTFGSIWISVAITSTAALPTIPNDWNRIFGSFLVATLVGYSLGTYFLLRWHRQKDSLGKLMDRIRSSQIPQWGDERKELRGSELDKLTPQLPVTPRSPPSEEPVSDHEGERAS